MSANGKLLANFAVKETREIDLGEYADIHAGSLLEVWVNAPGVMDWMVKRKDANSYDAERHVVAILFDMAFVEVKALDDAIMLWLFTKGADLYTEYHASLKKKSSADSLLTSIPSTATP